MTPNHTLTKKRYLYLLSTVTCALSRSHEWELTPCMFDSLGSHTGVIGEQNVTNHLGVSINPMAELQPETHVRRCKIPSTWYGYIPLRNVLQTLARNTEAGRQTLYTSACTSVLTMPAIFSSSFTLRCTSSSWRFALGKEPISRRRWWSRAKTRRLCISHREYRCHHSRAAWRYRRKLVFKIYISAYPSWKNGMFDVTYHYTLPLQETTAVLLPDASY
jgi:hypothetical protein